LAAWESLLEELGLSGARVGERRSTTTPGSDRNVLFLIDDRYADAEIQQLLPSSVNSFRVLSAAGLLNFFSSSSNLATINFSA
jgi:hypothetical protein